MANAIYKRILQLVEKWPIDPNKPGRDLGQYLRQYISQAHQEGKFTGNEQYWDRQYLSLQRLTNNEHCSKYTRGLSSTATGLTAEQCNSVLTKEFLDFLDKENISPLKKIFSGKSKSNIAEGLLTAAHNLASESQECECQAKQLQERLKKRKSDLLFYYKKLKRD